MIATLATFLWGLTAFDLLAFAAALLISARTFRHAQNIARSEQLPALSLIKPLKGEEYDLEKNLKSAFEQVYPGTFEIVFSAAELNDPAVATARQLAKDYPNVPARFVQSDPGFGLNPKVANLAGGVKAAKHDLVLHTDANVRLPNDYASKVVQQLEQSQGALLSSMVIGVGEKTLGAAFENLQLTTMILPEVAIADHILKVPCVIGKSMLFRRSELEELGGLKEFSDVLCEDFVLGSTYKQAGKQVIISGTPVANINANTSVREFVQRHSRWLKMRAAIHFPAFTANLLISNPTAIALIAWGLSGFVLPQLSWVLGTAVIKTFGDALALRILRGISMPWRWLMLAPVKDLLMALVWPYASVSRRVRWRGATLRMGKNSRIV